MKWTSLALATALAVVTADSTAATSRSRTPPLEKSADLLKAPTMRRALESLPPPAPAAISLAAAPALEDVGDADSFGRNVTYLGLAQSLAVVVQDSCAGSDPAVERCVVKNPAPAATPFNETGLATINLPAKATKSLVCFSLTPFIGVTYENLTATQQQAQFSAAASIIIDNDVLNDPALINPDTGLPFAGSLSLSLSTWHDFHSIQPGEFESHTQQQTRSCIAGIVSKRSLVDTWGLSETQATQFFKKPITLHFGARGSVRSVSDASYLYGVRLYGD